MSSTLHCVPHTESIRERLAIIVIIIIILFKTNATNSQLFTYQIDKSSMFFFSCPNLTISLTAHQGLCWDTLKKKKKKQWKPNQLTEVLISILILTKYLMREKKKRMKVVKKWKQGNISKFKMFAPPSVFLETAHWNFIISDKWQNNEQFLTLGRKIWQFWISVTNYGIPGPKHLKPKSELLVPEVRIWGWVCFQTQLTAGLLPAHDAEFLCLLLC